MHFVTALIGVALVCAACRATRPGVGDLRRCGALEWPVRVALIVGGLMFAAPGGGLMPLSPVEMTIGAIAVTAPALALAIMLARRRATR